jgi:hypothetical protein
MTRLIKEENVNEKTHCEFMKMRDKEKKLVREGESEVFTHNSEQPCLNLAE